jgi:hypothetical protein
MLLIMFVNTRTLPGLYKDWILPRQSDLVLIIIQLSWSSESKESKSIIPTDLRLKRDLGGRQRERERERETKGFLFCCCIMELTTQGGGVSGSPDQRPSPY